MSKRTRQKIRIAAKYIFLEAAGIALFKIASAYAYTQRGYIAVGGEYFLLLLPLIYKMVADMGHSVTQTVKELAVEWEEERARCRRRKRQTAIHRMMQERSSGQ